MLAKVLSATVVGIDAILVDVEVDIAQGLPQFATVGLPDGAVKESKDRVKAALKTRATNFPPSGSPPIWPRPILKRRAPPLTCRSPSAFWLPPASSTANDCHATFWRVNCPWMVP